MPDPEQVFPLRLRQARRGLRLTQAALARQIGTQRKRICILEQGAEHPNITTLAKLAVALEVSTDWLLGLTDTPQAGDSGVLTEMPEELSPANRHWLLGLAKVLVVEQQAMAHHVEQWGRAVPCTRPTPDL